MLKTTFEKIRKAKPCSTGWNQLLSYHNKDMDMNREISLVDILKSNGIDDAIWAVKHIHDYKDYCLFMVELAENTLPYFKEADPNNPLLEQILESIKDYHRGNKPYSQIKLAGDNLKSLCDSKEFEFCYRTKLSMAAVVLACGVPLTGSKSHWRMYTIYNSLYAGRKYSGKIAKDIGNYIKYMEETFIKHFS